MPFFFLGVSTQRVSYAYYIFTMFALTGCGRSSPSMVVKIIAPPENMLLIINGPSYVGVHFPMGSTCGNMTRLITKCDTVGELTWGFAFVFAKCFGLARVATDSLFYPKEGSKSTGKTFEIFSWVRGVDYEKGRCKHPFHPWLSMGS